MRFALYLPDDKLFLQPYLARALSGFSILDPADTADADLCIMVSSTDIYGAGEFVNIDESTPIDENCIAAIREKEFVDLAKKHIKPAVILRCANIVGTGMTGFPRELANAIWRGTFFHFPGNEARVSTIHAADVAAITALVAEKNFTIDNIHIFNLSDGDDPYLHDLAEALAFRMSNKRISTLSTGPQQWLGRIAYGKRKYSSYTTTRTISCVALHSVIDYSPTPVCQYLRTHNYDESSL